MDGDFGVVPKRALPNPRLQRFSAMSSSWDFKFYILPVLSIIEEYWNLH